MKRTAFCAIFCFGLLTSCSKPSTQETATESSYSAEPAESTTEAMVQLLNFADVANAFHSNAQVATRQMLTQCSQMKADIDAFLKSPSNDSQAKARDSFLPCYQGWIGASLYFQRPFDLSEAKEFNNLMDLIDTRPFLPGYIDGIPDYPYSGLVHEMDLPITAENLRGQHRLMDEDSASVGFPAIEFFLWKMPVESIWVAVNTDDKSNIIERRHSYLEVVTNLLIDQLTQSILRWQPTSDFAELPERAQLSLVLKSLQRSAFVDLLTNGFESVVVNEPEWHHPALISGHGRSYPLLRLSQIQSFLSTEAFGDWLSRQIDTPVSLEQLNAAVSASIEAVQKLPENYPSDTGESDSWFAARQQVANLALLLSKLSEHFQVGLVTE